MLRILTPTISVPTFVTKVKEYLSSGWFFFLQTTFDFLGIFDGNFKNPSEDTVLLSLN